MALKGTHEKIRCDDINFRCETVGVRGAVVVYTSTGVKVNSGAPNANTQRVAGMLLLDVVNKNLPSNYLLGDETGTMELPKNFNKNETHVSGVVRLLKVGEAQTDQWDTGEAAKVGPGSGLYVAAGGKLTTLATHGQLLGRALSAVNSDGFVKVFLNVI